MRDVWLIARQEVITRLNQPSFLIGALGLPIFAWLLFGAAAWVNRDAPDLVGNVIRNAQAPRPAGFVDRPGMLETLPESFPDDLLKRYPDEPAAREALGRDEIAGYYVIPLDVVDSGRVTYVGEDVNALANSEHTAWLEWALTVDMLGGDEPLAERVRAPVVVHETTLAPERPRDEGPLAFILPYAITLAFYTTLFGAASHNISALTTEKENRVIEVLLTSIAPRRLFAGKILGLGFLGMLQAALWLGTSFGLARGGAATFGWGAEFSPTPALVAWGMVFFTLGYLIYASLLAGVGALVPTLREAAQAAFVVNSPLLVPLMLMGLLVDDPNGRIAVALSLFPLTAPVVMLTRLAAGDPVPAWQLGLATLLLVATAILTVRSVAGLFRAQVLLAGQPLNLRRVVRAMRAGF